MHKECTKGNEQHLNKMHCDSAWDIFKASTNKWKVPEPYSAYAQVISDTDSESMHSHGLWFLTIEIFNVKQPPCDVSYNLSK